MILIKIVYFIFKTLLRAGLVVGTLVFSGTSHRFIINTEALLSSSFPDCRLLYIINTSFCIHYLFNSNESHSRYFVPLHIKWFIAIIQTVYYNFIYKIQYSKIECQITTSGVNV